MSLFALNLRGMSKPRPRGSGKNFYMPAEYMAWKQQVATMLVEAGIPTSNYEGPVELVVTFSSDKMYLQVTPLLDIETRPKHLKRNDLDNLVGGIMDALQDANVIRDDVQVLRIVASFDQEGTT